MSVSAAASCSLRSSMPHSERPSDAKSFYIRQEREPLSESKGSSSPGARMHPEEYLLISSIKIPVFITLSLLHIIY